MSAYLKNPRELIFKPLSTRLDVLGEFQTVKALKVNPKFPKTAKTRVVQALIRFGHRAIMISFKFCQVFVYLRFVSINLNPDYVRIH
jgi:hypothetical protein